MHFSFKHAPNLSRYDQNNDHNLERMVVPVSKRQRFNHKHPETLLSVPEVKIRQPLVEDARYGLPPPTTSSSESSNFPYAVPRYDPSPAVVQLIQRYSGPGIQSNPYARNSWELLKPFKHIVNSRYTRMSSLPEPRILVDWGGDNHRSNNAQRKSPRTVPQSTGKDEQGWRIHPPFCGVTDSTGNYRQLDSRNEMEDTMSIDPVLLQDAYGVSTSASHSLSLYSTQTSTSLGDTIASESPATNLLSVYNDPNPSLSLDSSAMQMAASVPTIINFSPSGSSPSHTSIPSSPVIPPSPPSTVSVPVSSPTAGSNRLSCFSSSRLSSPLRPVSRRRRTSQKRRASSPDSDPPLRGPAHDSKRLRLCD